MTTFFSPHLLRAALVRGGVWLVDRTSMPTEFYHRQCFDLAQRQLPTV